MGRTLIYLLLNILQFCHDRFECSLQSSLKPNLGNLTLFTIPLIPTTSTNTSTRSKQIETLIILWKTWMMGIIGEYKVLTWVSSPPNSGASSTLNALSLLTILLLDVMKLGSSWLLIIKFISEKCHLPFHSHNLTPYCYSNTQCRAVFSKKIILLHKTTYIQSFANLPSNFAKLIPSSSFIITLLLTPQPTPNNSLFLQGVSKKMQHLTSFIFLSVLMLHFYALYGQIGGPPIRFQLALIQKEI